VEKESPGAQMREFQFSSSFFKGGMLQCCTAIYTRITPVLLNAQIKLTTE
jgi:hypothetical protein